MPPTTKRAARSGKTPVADARAAPAKGAAPARAEAGAAAARDARMANTLVRGLRVLQAFRSNDDGPVPNKDIAARTGLPKATVSRLLHTFASLGYVAVDRRSGGYSLAPGVLSFAHVFLSRLDIRALARPLMQKLPAPPGTTVVLAMRDRSMMTTIEAIVADPRFQLRAWIGASAPIALTASGHAFLAGLSEPLRAAALAELKPHYAKEWPAIAAHIERSLRAVAARGYCVEIGEWKTQVSDVAVPIRLDPAGGTVLTLACGGPPQMLPQRTLDKLGRLMVSVGEEIERSLAVRL